MKWPVGIAAAVLALVAIAVAVPFFVPLDDYIPKIEREASERLKEPVTIRRIRLSALPLPHAIVEGIAVGKGGDVTVGKVIVTPELTSLFSATKVIRSIEVDSLVLARKAMEKIPLWAKQDGGTSPAAVRIRSVRLDGALVKFGSTNFGPFDARVSLDDNGAPADVTLQTRDGRLKALVTPVKSDYRIAVNAKGWTLPAGPPITFDTLDVEGVATLSEVNFSRIGAKLYGGAATGKATLGWQKGFQLKGSLDLDRVELAKLVPLLSPGTRFSGQLTAKPVFTASSKDAGGLLHALRISTPFDIQNGVFHGVDLLQSAITLGKQGSSSGETRFDRLSGRLAMEHSAYRLTDLRIGSGALAADGSVGISARKELSGRVNAQVKMLGAATTVPLNVAGTLASPIVLPTRGAMAGAAIGTVMMPGVGTGVGMKAGQMIEGLFGRN